MPKEMEDIRIQKVGMYIREVGPRVWLMGKANKHSEMEISMKEKLCMEPSLDMGSMPIRIKKNIRAAFIIM